MARIYQGKKHEVVKHETLILVDNTICKFTSTVL